MPTVSLKLGNLTGFSASDNLSDLPDKQAKVIGVVDNTSLKYPNSYMSFSFAATSAALASLAYDGAIELYFLPCVDVTNDIWTDGIASQATNNVAASLFNAKLISPPITANTPLSGQNIKYVINDLAKEVGDMPQKFVVVVYNKSGQDFPNSGHKAVYQLRSYTI